MLSKFWFAALAQSPEAGRIERNGTQAPLIIESPRPLDVQTPGARRGFPAGGSFGYALAQWAFAAR
jgi:hypothetical protein